MLPRKTITTVLIAGGVALAGLAGTAVADDTSFIFRFKAAGVSPAEASGCEPGHKFFGPGLWSQQFVVPDGCETLEITAVGGDSGGADNIPDQKGEYIQITRSVEPGDYLDISTGAGGDVYGEWLDGYSRVELAGSPGGSTVILRDHIVMLLAEGGSGTATVSERGNQYWNGAGGWALLEWGGADAPVPNVEKVEVEVPIKPPWVSYFQDNRGTVPAAWTDGFSAPYSATPPSKPYPVDVVDGSIDFRMRYVANINGLANLKSVGGNYILNGNDLTDLYGLSSLESVGGDLNLEGNKFASVDYLTNLKSVGGDLKLESNPHLTNVDGLTGLQSVGGNLRLNFVAGLTSINGLTNLKAVGGSLYIYRADDLTSLDGLSDLETIGSNLLVRYSGVTSLDGLSGLKSIGGKLEIAENSDAISLYGLRNLQSVGEIFMDKGIHVTTTIPPSAWLCQPAQANKFSERYLSQAKACGF